MVRVTPPADIVRAIDELVLATHAYVRAPILSGAEMAAMAACDRARDALDAIICRHLPTAKPRIRVPYRREPEVQIVDHLGSAARRTAA